MDSKRLDAARDAAALIRATLEHDDKARLAVIAACDQQTTLIYLASATTGLLRQMWTADRIRQWLDDWQHDLMQEEVDDPPAGDA